VSRAGRRVDTERTRTASLVAMATVRRLELHRKERIYEFVRPIRTGLEEELMLEHVLHTIEMAFATYRLTLFFDGITSWHNPGKGTLKRFRGLAVVDANLLHIRLLHDFLYRDQTCAVRDGKLEKLQGEALAVDFVRDPEAWLNEIRPV
jgi:hypothetical protein